MTNNGQKWATGGLIFGAAISLMGNVAHTFLADSTISLWLRVPLAVLWPVALFVGIEILVRIDWRRNFIDWIGRALLVGPVSAVAAVVSYLHLHSLMGMAGEDWFSKLIGPAAIDGLLLGSTVALLAIRAHRATPAPEIGLEETPDLEEIMERWDIRELTEESAGKSEISSEEILSAIPVSPAPVRTPRASWDARKVAEMAVDGARTQEIVDATSAGRSTVDRFRKVAKMLVANPRAEIDFAKEKLSAEHVTIMRELVTR